MGSRRATPKSEHAPATSVQVAVEHQPGLPVHAGVGSAVVVEAKPLGQTVEHRDDPEALAGRLQPLEGPPEVPVVDQADQGRQGGPHHPLTDVPPSLSGGEV